MMPHPGEMQAALSTAPAIQTVAVTASPFTFIASDPGRVIVRGGTVSLVEVERYGVFVDMGIIAGPIPMSRGDSIRVTYIVAPTMNYFKG